MHINSSPLRPAYAKYLAKESPKSIFDLCHVQDLPRMKSYINEMVHTPSAHARLSDVSILYRIRLGGPDSYVNCKIQSQYFRSDTPVECDFIMAMHMILTDEEAANLELAAGNSTSVSLSNQTTGNTTMSPMLQYNNSSSNMGGPLMTSIVNGGISHSSLTSRMNSGMTTSITNFSSPPVTDNSVFEYELDTFATTSFGDIESVNMSWDSRPNSRASATPINTSRPPSVSAYSPANVCPSPLGNYQSSNPGQPSPSNNNNNNNSLANNNTNAYGSYGYGGFEEKENKEQILSQQNSQQQQTRQFLMHGQQQQQLLQQHTSHQHGQEMGKLRDLLTKRSGGNPLSGGNENDQISDHKNNNNKILKVCCILWICFHEFINKLNCLLF